ncbi:MAG: HAD family hydrolase [Chloroflexi bacterium]|nr:HAD family hydrolase [Chloroflexota bacterium]
MIKAIFFDWFNTLARYEPHREELQSQVLQEFDIHVSPQKIMPGLAVADREYLEENAVSPVRKRTPEEQSKVYSRYQQTILTEAGVSTSLPPDRLVQIMKRVQQLAQGMDFVLFDNVLPTLKTLKERNLTLGLLSNIDWDMQPVCARLGLGPYINFTVTAGEVGADKPEPAFFLAALRKAGVNASEAIHVGDQYKIDIAGAKGVGIKAILIDRYGSSPEPVDCPRIHTLPELTAYIR